MANERMTFTLVGRDRLSREFNQAGRSAADLQRDIERASAQSRESLAGLQRDAQGRLRDMRGRFASAGAAAEAMGDDVDGAFTRISRSADRASVSLRKIKFGAIAAGIAAAVPAAAALTASLVSLAAAAGAATAGVASFGLAIAPQVKKIKAASDAQTKLGEAMGEHGALSEEAIDAQNKLNAAISDANPAISHAVSGFLDLRRAYEDWSDSLASDTMPVLTHSFVTMGEVLPRLTPLVRSTSRELDRLMAVAAGGASGGAFGKFVDNVAELSGSTLHRVTTELANLSRTMESIDTTMWDRFMRLADEHGADAAEALSNMAEALGNILLAAGETGVGILQVANAVAQLVNAIPPDLLSTVIQVYAAFKLWGLAAAGVQRLGVALAAMNVSLVTMRANAAAAGGAMALLRARMAALSAGGVLGLVVAGAAAAAYGINKLAENARGAPADVDRLTTSLKELAASGKFSGELATAFGDLEGLGTSLERLTVDAQAFSRANEIMGGTIGNSVRKLHDLVDSFWHGEESAKAAREDFAALDKSLASLVKGGHADAAAEAFDRIKAAAKAEGVSIKDLNRALPEYRDALKAAEVAQRLAAQGMGLFGEKALETTAKLEDQKASADGLRKAYFELNNAMLVARGGVRGMEAAIDDATAAVKENGATLDINTEKGRANQQALDQIAASTMEAATAARENGQSWASVAGILDRGRGALVKTAQQMGMTSAEANRLADRILKIPDRKVMFEGETKDLDQKIEAAQRHVDSLKQQRATTLKGDRGPIDAAVRRAQERVDSLKQKRAALLKARDATGPGVNSAQANINSVKGKTVDIFVNIWRNTHNRTFTHKAPGVRKAQGGPIRGYATGGEVQGFPTGGAVQGPGTATSDSIPAMLSDGEFVIRAAMVRRYGESFFAMLNQGSLPLDRPSAGSKDAFARGGLNVGREVASGLRDALPAVRDAAQRLGKEFAGQASKPSGYARAVAELNRLVDSGRWDNKGSRLFEDISFQGMSKNFGRHQDRVADGFWAAVNEIKRAVRSGKLVHEDMTFKGMSGNVRRFHDAIAQIWKGNPYGSNFGDWGNFGKYGQYGTTRMTNSTRSATTTAAPNTTNINVYPQRANFTVSELEALQRRSEARARIGRPR